MINNFNNVHFTYYGDLLGISNFYSIDPGLAKENLDYLYNSTFNLFKDKVGSSLKVYLFSDTIIISGIKLEDTILSLSDLYFKLFKKSLLLRGAIVKGKLEFDPRIQLKNLEKKLPTSDVLYRAVALERSVKGSRLLIEKPLSKELIPKIWYNDDLYHDNIKGLDFPIDDFRRKIILTNEWVCYEYLWPWNENILGNSMLYEKKYAQNLIKRTIQRVPKSVKSHYKATEEIFRLAYQRYQLTYISFKNE